jgi:hypothetical protein
VTSHLCLPFTHIFISLDQARELLHDSQLTKRFGKHLSNYTEIKSEIQGYISRITSFSHSIEKFKSEIFSLIERECQAKLAQLASMKSKAEASLEAVNKIMKNISSSDSTLFSRYEEMGLRGLIDNYHDRFEILSSSIKHEISEMIVISDSLEVSNISDLDLNRSIISHSVEIYPYESRYIYLAKYNSKILAKFDADTLQTSTFDLSESISHNFIASATCILPDNNVMIVGGYSTSYHGDTYKFNTSTLTCTSLNALNFPRGFVHLYCYDKYLYAFGGNSGTYSNKAERMDWNGTGWHNLPNMKEKRCAFGSFCIDGKLYLCGGFKVNSVEMFEFRTNKFNIVQNLIVPKGFNMAAIVDDKIYHVTKDFITVMDKEFTYSETKTLMKHSYVINLSGVVVRTGRVIFNWYNEEAVYEVDSMDKDIKLLAKY